MLQACGVLKESVYTAVDGTFFEADKCPIVTETCLKLHKKTIYKRVPIRQGRTFTKLCINKARSIYVPES